MGVERRLLDGVTEATAAHGYGALTVERVLAAASVSRASFYQYFTSVEDCFYSAYREHAAQLVGDVAHVARSSAQPELATLAALADLAGARPSVARLLMGESLAAGPGGLRERDALIAGLVDSMTLGGRAPAAIDLPPAVLIGGSLGFLSMRLAGREPAGQVRAGMLEWARAFARRPSEPSWSARLTPPTPQRESSTCPPAMPASREGDSRDRILHATMATIRDRGYGALTVADIVAVAGVSRRQFYNGFPSKQAAVIAAYEHGFQQTLAAVIPAFFTSGSWPERVWSSSLAFTGFLAREPLIAHLGFLEAYAIGRDYVPRLHDTQLAFTLFLEEGFRQRPEAEALSRSCAALTAAAIFELAFQGSRRGPGEHLRRLQPLAVHIALTPFIGAATAGAFVEGKLAASAADAVAVA